MRIILFTHPSFLNSQSMPRFSGMLADGMKKRGHEVDILTPEPQFYKTPVPQSLKKWMGYIDQYILFPLKVKRIIKQEPKDTLFVFTDHALGPWIPLAAHRAHVIHCHDFLAQLSAVGKIIENPTSATGKKYQAFIRNGYKKGKNFISVSKKTQEDLHRFLETKPLLSEMVYNGLNQSFVQQNITESQEFIGKDIGVDLSRGYILHVGGNQWYKNRVGVIEIYEAWREKYQTNLPLIMLGPIPNVKVMAKHSASVYKDDIYLLSGKDDSFVKKAYSGAKVFLFPSLAEGFGWPIAEAMASGCPVIITGEAPMTEVAGTAAFLINKRPNDQPAIDRWAAESASVLNKLISMPDSERQTIVETGLINAKRFDSDEALDKIEDIYKKIISAN